MEETKHMEPDKSTLEEPLAVEMKEVPPGSAAVVDVAPPADASAPLTSEGARVAAPAGGEEPHPPHYEGKKATARITVLNMMCNVIGGGVLALPTAFHDSSLVVGLILLPLTAMFTIGNLYFIVECAEATQIFDYRKLLFRGLGPYGSRVVDFALFVFPFGALCAYAVVIADSMPPVMQHFLHASGFWLNRICWLLIGGVVFFALSCRRSLSELKVSSFFGLLTIFYAVFVVMFRFFDGTYSPGGHQAAHVAPGLDPAYLKGTMFKTIPVMVFSFSVHNNAPTYYQELEGRRPAKMYRVIGISHAIIITTYALMAVFGLLTFGPAIATKAEGNILHAYAKSDVLMNTARLGMFIHFACVYPILQMAARRGFNNFVFRTNDLPMWKLCVESFFIVVASCVLAGLVPNIDTILSINGALFGSLIVMMAPSALFLFIDPWEGRDGRSLRRGLAIASIVFGFVVGVLGLWATISDVVNKKPVSPEGAE